MKLVIDHIVEYNMQVQRLIVLLKTMIFVMGRNGEVAFRPAAGENIRYVTSFEFSN